MTIDQVNSALRHDMASTTYDIELVNGRVFKNIVIVETNQISLPMTGGYHEALRTDEGFIIRANAIALIAPSSIKHPAFG